MDNNSPLYYNKLASEYKNVSKSRLNYLNAIDTLIVKNSKLVKSYLDVGAGDGRRSIKIAEKVRAKKSILLDNSHEISKGISNFQGAEFFFGTIEDLDNSIKFDLITCLWNVLGHVGDSDNRMSFFKNVKRLLSKNGTCILDVNNRYNMTHYGANNVAENLRKDIQKEERSGYFKLSIDSVNTEVYTHAPFEIEKLLAQTGLMVKELLYVDYDSGELKDSCFEGQLLYLIEHE